MRFRSVGEDLNRSLRRAMQKQLRPPVEVALLAPITPCRLLVLVHSAKRIVELLIKIAEQTMQLRLLARRQHLSRVFARACQLSIGLIGQREIKAVRKAFRMHAVSRFEQRDGLPISLRPEIEIPELLIGLIVPWPLNQRCAQFAFSLRESRS